MKSPSILEPCPFCASLDLEVLTSRETNTGSQSVKCWGCGCWGPYGASNEGLATEFWNRRASGEDVEDVDSKCALETGFEEVICPKHKTPIMDCPIPLEADVSDLIILTRYRKEGRENA